MTERRIHGGIKFAYSWLVLIPISTITAHALYTWFIRPLGFPEIGLVHMYGILMVTRYFCNYAVYDTVLAATILRKEAERRDPKLKFTHDITGMLYNTLYPLFALLIGWITHNFI